MKVILNTDIETLGRKGEIVDVKPGYARNFLLPKNLAITATKNAVRQAEEMRRAREERDRQERKTHEELAAKIASTPLRFAVRAGESGTLYGSVTTGDIARLLTGSLDETFDRKKIEAEPIRQLGKHTFKVNLPFEIEAEGSIDVIRDGAPVPESEMPREEGSPADETAEEPQTAAEGPSGPTEAVPEAGERDEPQDTTG